MHRQPGDFTRKSQIYSFTNLSKPLSKGNYNLNHRISNLKYEPCYSKNGRNNRSNHNSGDSSLAGGATKSKSDRWHTTKDEKNFETNVSTRKRRSRMTKAEKLASEASELLKEESLEIDDTIVQATSTRRGRRKRKTVLNTSRLNFSDDIIEEDEKDEHENDQTQETNNTTLDTDENSNTRDSLIHIETMRTTRTRLRNSNNNNTVNGDFFRDDAGDLEEMIKDPKRNKKNKDSDDDEDFSTWSTNKINRSSRSGRGRPGRGKHKEHNDSETYDDDRSRRSRRSNRAKNLYLDDHEISGNGEVNDELLNGETMPYDYN